MSRVSTSNVRRWISVLMLGVFVASLGYWLLQRERLPPRVRIATGKQGGMYYDAGKAIADSLRNRLDCSVNAVETEGSVENFERARSGASELAIVQGGIDPIQELFVVTPLFPEYIFVIVRRGRGIETMSDLAGKAVSLGKQGSGNRASAKELLKHYGIAPTDNDPHSIKSFRDLRSDSSLDAAIVTAAVEHSGLREVLASDEFELLPIRSAAAIDLVHHAPASPICWS